MGAVPGCARGARAQRRLAQPLPGRRRLPPPQRDRRAPRRRAGQRDHGCRRRRDHRASLARSARSGRRGRHRLALVHQLRARRTEGRRRASEGAARRRPLRPGRTARRDRAEDEAGLHRDAEQPHGHDDDARSARRLLRTCPRARPHGSRPGLLRVHRPARLSRRRRGVPRPRAPGARAADVLEDLRARRSTGRLRRRPDGRDPGDRQDPARIRCRHAGTGRSARQHRWCRRARREAPA